MERKEFQLNEVIFKDGVYQPWMYSICEGSVDIYSGYGTDGEKKLITLTKGQFFGEIGLIAVMPRTATAVAAQENVVLEQIGNDDFTDYLNNHPEHLQAIMSSVSKRIRELTDDLSMVSQLTAEALGEKKAGHIAARWPMELADKLLGKIKTKWDSRSEFVALRKRQQALSAEASAVIRLAAGSVIFRAGDPSDCLYDIGDGYVGIYSDYQTGNEKLLAKLSTDEVFGEMGILDDMPRSATAVCLTECMLRVVKPESFMAFFQTKPAKVLTIMQQMCMELRNLTQKYLDVCKTLETMRSLDEKDVQTDAAMEKINYLGQIHLAKHVMYSF